MWPETREKTELEIGQLRDLFAHYRNLLEKVRDSAPETIEVSALGSFLHSFYTGVENIFKRIATEVDRAGPSGERWHAELLVAVSQPRPHRAAVISPHLKLALVEYLEFRHMFRHAYDHLLRWSRMNGLVLNAEEVLNRLEAELRSFFSGDAPDEAT